MYINRRELAFLIVSPQAVRGSAANSAVRLGMVGCGGRGTGVAASFVENAAARLTALADLFPDNLNAARARLAKFGDIEEAYSGPRAAEQLFASQAVDAVYIATPVWFHPEHFEAAVAAGKHVYVEKPAGVDVPGVNRMLRAAARARGRLSITMGLQLRHASPYVEQVRRIHAGALGEIVCGLVHYYAGAIDRPAWPNASPAERRLRNWIHDRVLSGDIVVEQNVHVIDFTNWVLGAHPLKASGVCGRKGRRDQGDCKSHFDCTFSYPNDVHISFASTQFINGAWDVAMRYFGTRGNSEARYDAPVNITGAEKWEFPDLGKPGQVTDSKVAATGVFRGALDDADANKQKQFIQSIVTGKLLDDITPGAESTLSAIMARTAAYHGREVTWQETLRSNEVWDAKLEIAKL
ncbi:MAG: Gfo/Idh/MocA family protein [Bryobacteraceae bacterium]